MLYQFANLHVALTQWPLPNVLPRASVGGGAPPNVRRLDYCLITYCLWPAGLRRVGTEVLEILLQCSALEASQASYVFCRWAVTTWPSSLG